MLLTPSLTIILKQFFRLADCKKDFVVGTSGFLLGENLFFELESKFSTFLLENVCQASVPTVEDGDFALVVLSKLLKHQVPKKVTHVGPLIVPTAIKKPLAIFCSYQLGLPAFVFALSPVILSLFSWKVFIFEIFI